MIDSYSNIAMRAGDASPTTIVLRPSPSPRNPQNLYPDAAEVLAGVRFGAGQLQWQEYAVGTLIPGSGGSNVFMVNE